jgi:hypothetical protein
LITSATAALSSTMISAFFCGPCGMATPLSLVFHALQGVF